MYMAHIIHDQTNIAIHKLQSTWLHFCGRKTIYVVKSSASCFQRGKFSLKERTALGGQSRRAGASRWRPGRCRRSTARLEGSLLPSPVLSGVLRNQLSFEPQLAVRHGRANWCRCDGVFGEPHVERLFIICTGSEREVGCGTFFHIPVVLVRKGGANARVIAGKQTVGGGFAGLLRP